MILFEIIPVGIIATLCADLWQQALKRTAGVPTGNWSLVGRWVAGFPRGAFIRPAVAADPSVAAEGAIGWVFHYGVGLLYAAMFVAIADALGSGPSLMGALAFGLATLVGPWFVLKPALGLGIFGRRAPHPWRDVAVTLTTHLAFGLGLYLGSRVVLARW